MKPASKSILAITESRIDTAKRVVRPLYQAWKHGRDLKCTIDRTDRIRGSDILLFSTIRNEKWRLPYFLDYYRNRGVSHFFFVDNGSTDDLQDYLKQQTDCSCWYTEASYKFSNFGMHWLNSLLRRYGTGHWCLTCDPDEFLVYPYCEDRNLHELVEFLSNENMDHLFCLMLDMYGKGPVRQTHCAPGQNPLEVAPYFDSTGYVQSPNLLNGDVWVQGGVRRRTSFRYAPSRAPAVNKTPLIFWKKHYAYTSSMHVANLKRLNRPHKLKHVSPTGCILHFKFLSSIIEKAAEEMQRKQHYANSAEYRSYKQLFESGEEHFFCEISEPYDGSRKLIQLGLMTTGQWF